MSAFPAPLAWYEDEARFAAELARGRRVEIRHALELLPLGLAVKVGLPLPRTGLASRDPLCQEQADIEVEGGHVLEVKGRRYAFTGPDDFPFETAFVGACRRWRARKRKPCAVVLVSEPTGACVVAPTATFDQWRIERAHDPTRGFTDESYGVPRRLLLPLERLVQHLRAPCTFTNTKGETMTAKTAAPAATSLRKNHGRGHSYWIDGEKVPGVTGGVLGKGFPKPALLNWAAETTAGYAVDNWDDLAKLTPSKRLKQLMRARFDVQGEASLKGTNFHSLAKRHLAGEEVDVPDELEGRFRSYERFLEEWQPLELLVEAPLFSRRHRYGGTPDLIAELVDGKVWLLDWKTGLKGVFLDHVLQLAALRFAEYTVTGGIETPVPAIDETGVVHLRDDGYDLVPVQADARAFAVFRAVHIVAQFIDGEREDWVGDALAPEVSV